MSDDNRWGSLFLDICRRSNALEVELLPWEDAESLEGPVAVLVADSTTPWEQVSDPFETWAARAWQPCVVVHRRSRPGAARFDARLAELGYGRVVQGIGSESSVATTVEESVAVRDRCLWVIPPFCTRLGIIDPEILSALSTVAASPRDIRTVKSWARSLGLAAWKLRAKFRERGLPSPKRVFDGLRLALVVGHAATEEGRFTRDDWACEFGYSSGAYLGRCAKRITRRSFGALLKDDPLGVVRELAAAAEST